MKRMSSPGGSEGKPASEGNRYTRAARVLAKNDKISMKELADRAFMSESTAARCLEAGRACVAAFIEAGRLPIRRRRRRLPELGSCP
jgi:AraC-like DNA-binding protein